MTEEVVTDIAELNLPFNRHATVKNVEFNGGLNMLRLTLREGRRFTIVDLDQNSAAKLGALMVRWSEVSGEKPQNEKGA